jgi:membrane protein implicated in regulation of membrane protease activity
MSLHIVRSLRAIRMATLAALALGSVAAQAMSVNYQCIGYRPLKAELTPRQGQVHFEGKDWTVTRVRDSREARYVNAREGVVVVAKQREMTFTHGSETLQCFLKSDALPDSPGAKAH